MVQYKARSGWVANWLIDEIESLLRDITPGYGALLYERIGAIRFGFWWMGSCFERWICQGHWLNEGRAWGTVYIRDITAVRQNRYIVTVIGL